MRALLKTSLVATVCLMAVGSFACKRDSDSATRSRTEETANKVGKDVKDVGKATEKAAKDIGHATVELADKAGQHLEDATNKAASGSQDAWLTTKVKSALTAEGLDILHVHVDTEAKVVTLSGSVDSAARREKAVAVARGVVGVLDVKDHLFVKPETR
jgi:osmotically-inducible protein OsmY